MYMPLWLRLWGAAGTGRSTSGWWPPSPDSGGGAPRADRVRQSRRRGRSGAAVAPLDVVHPGGALGRERRGRGLGAQLEIRRRERLEHLAQLADALLEAELRTPGRDRVLVVPRPDADEPAGLILVLEEPADPRAGRVGGRPFGHLA